MLNEKTAQDPLEFVRGMWNNMGFSLPGMVAPTLDVDELDKRIADLKAVENWLKMNLSMLQMTTQGLEMQRAAIAAVQAMSQHVRESGSKTEAAEQPNPFASAAMWPWNMMGGQATGPQAADGAATAPGPREPAASAARKAAAAKK